jgi:hypothetical protein
MLLQSGPDAGINVSEKIADGDYRCRNAGKWTVTGDHKFAPTRA